MGYMTAEALLAARAQFLESGNLPAGLVSAAIARSWQRCAALGLAAQLARPPEPTGGSALRELKERTERLVRLCRPEMEALSGDAAASGAILVLTDAAGTVLEAVGDPGFAASAARVALRPGALWAENAAGTNAVGTALAERRPIEVRGAEHFFDRNRILTCAAAPIQGPDGTQLGVLDLTGAAGERHLHALALVRMAVEQIEHRMFAAGFDGHEMIRFHRDPALLGTAREGILVFAGESLVAGNRHGLSLVGLDVEALGQRRYGELFAEPPGGGTDRLRRPDGTVLHARMSLPARSVVPLAVPRTRTLGANSEREAPILDPAAQARLAASIRLLDNAVPVLIQGETGAGKEVFARAVHAGSQRAGQVFIAVNCAALPESLIEAELFGYEEGAFTGARRQGAKGLLRAADGGVLFLDEIGDMPLSLQARLLRVLQEREVMPLGSTKAWPVDFTLICATHRDLEAAVAAGTFRADLYFRIAQYTVRLAALRDYPDRAEILRALWARLGGPACGIDLPESCMAVLAAYDWPGNFRQAAGTLRALLALAEPERPLGIDDLPASIVARIRTAPVAAPAPMVESPLGATARLGEIEVAAMKAAVDACGGNISQAAKRLGVSRSTLYRRLFGGR